MSFQRKDYNILTRYRRFSSIRQVRPIRNYKAFYFFFWFLLGGGIIAFLLLPWQQTVHGSGRVIANSPNERRQDISAPIDGRVLRWDVLEGSKVRKGDPIVELVDNDPDLVSRLNLEKEAIERRLEAAQQGVETARKNVSRQEALFQKGLSSSLGIENARLNLNKYLVDEANASAELSRAQVKVARQMTQAVSAPIDGTILKLIAGQGGQQVKQGELLAVLVPDTDSRAVEIWVQGRDMPLIEKGRDVRLQFEGWPALQFSGWPSVAVGTFGGKVGFVDPADDGMGGFRVLIFPEEGFHWPDPNFLRQGVRVKGWILLDRVKIGFELWRLFNGFPPSLRNYELIKDSSSGGKISKNDIYLEDKR